MKLPGGVSIPNEINLYFTPKQTYALEVLDDPKVDEVMYGGAKGGGKTVFLVEYAFIQASRLARLFQLTDKDPIIPVGYLGRKRGVDFTKTTLETWKKIIPSALYKIRPLDREIIIEDRVKIFYGGMDDESSVNKMNSAEFAFICIDQAEEISKDDLGLLKGTLRLRYNNQVPAYKVLLTANPAPCFLKNDYIDNPPTDGSKVFIQALPTDNPFLDDKYVATLRDAFKHRPELIRAYVEGSWDDLGGLDILIKYNWVTQCIDHTPKEKADIRVTAADVSRYGEDETVIYNFIDYVPVSQDISGKNATEATASKIVIMATKNDSDIIVIDGDGFGGGVCDLVRSMVMNRKAGKMTVLEINSGRKAQNEKTYVNAKTEFWFHAAALFAEKRVGIPNDQNLITDLSSVKYQTVENGRFKIESKKDIRKRITRSPDRGDAYIYGIWAHQFVHKPSVDFSRLGRHSAPIDRGGYGWDKLTSNNAGARGGYGWT